MTGCDTETPMASTLSGLRYQSLAIGVGVIVGALTAYAQGWLNDDVSSLANSAGPWSLAAFLVARHGRRIVDAGFAAVATLASCELGYVLATEIRGGSNAQSTVVFWLAAAALAGAPLGIAGALSTNRGVQRGIGFAVIAGVLIGEGLYGSTVLTDTTNAWYWAAETATGIGIVVAAIASERRHAPVTIVVAATTTIVVYGAARLV